MGTLAFIELPADPDEMLHFEAFHQGLHCLPKQNQSTKKEIHLFLELLNVTPQNIEWNILTSL